MVSEDKQFVISIDVGATKTHTGLVAVNGGARLMASALADTVVDEEAVLVRLGAEIDGLLKASGVSPHQVGQVVIGVPGMVGPHGEIYNCYNLPAWERVDLSEVGRLIDRPVRVVRDIRLATLGEWRVDRGEINDLIVVYVGSGIGLGGVAGGRLLVGGRGMAGELGHWTMVPDGLPCSCGKRGCLETVASGWSFKQAAERLGHEGDVGALIRGWRAGWHEEASTVNTAIRYLGMAVGNLIKLLDPARVILGGGVIDQSPELSQAIASAAQDHAASRNLADAQIERSRLGNLAPLLGGAWVE